MVEETTNEERPAEIAPETVEASASNKPEVDLSSKIRLEDGSEVSVGQLVQDRTEAARVAESYEHAKVLMSDPGIVSADRREAAVRHIMAEQGYGPDAIDEYVSGLYEESPMTTEINNDAPTPPEETPDVSGGIGADLERRLNELEQQTAMAQDRSSRAELEMAKQRLQEAVSQTLDDHQGLGILLEKSKQLTGNDEARDLLYNELDRQTMEFMRARQARGETFSLNWFKEEASRAAEVVTKRFRTVIGDPDGIQRSPETESGHQALLKREAVKQPTWDRSKSDSDIRTEIRNFTTDQLTRAAAEMLAGGESKI